MVDGASGLGVKDTAQQLKGDDEATKALVSGERERFVKC